MTLEVEALELAEDRSAQVVLHVERDAPAAVTPDVRKTETRDTDAREHRDPRTDGSSPTHDAVVDDDLLDEWRERGEGRTENGDAERHDGVGLVRRHPVQKAPHPSHGPWGTTQYWSGMMAYVPKHISSSVPSAKMMYLLGRFGSSERSQLQSMRICWPAVTCSGVCSA